MKCDCCAKRKGLFEVFEPVQHEEGTLHLCVECCTLIYRIRDAQKYGNDLETQTLTMKVQKKKPSKAFLLWFERNYLTKKHEKTETKE